MEDRPIVRLTIDGQKIEARQGTTILEAATENGIRIPTLCHHPALSNWGGCRICVVEVDGSPRLVASCVMPVRDGMEVVTRNERILESRRTILEFLLAERNHYCMFCAQSGDCELQSLAYELGIDHIRVPLSFRMYPVDASNPHMVLDHNRCILCGRCVRACKELAGKSVLNYQNRGAHSLICKDLNDSTEDSDCDSCGVCLQLCPTGAIYSRLRPHQSVLGKKGSLRVVETKCPICGLLCSTRWSLKGQIPVRIDGVVSTERSDSGQLCWKGRFKPLEDQGERLLEPLVRQQDGALRPTTWEDALERVAKGLSTAKSKGGVMGLASGGCSSEEIYLLKELVEEGLGGCAAVTEGEVLVPLLEAWREMDRTFLGLKESSFDRLAEADLILFAEADPQATHPLVAALAKRAVLERKAAVTSLGSTRVLPSYNGLHVSVPQQALAVATRALLGSALGRVGGVDPLRRWRRILSVVEAFQEESKELDRATTSALEILAKGFVEARSPIIVAGEGMMAPGDPSPILNIMFLALLKGLVPSNALRLLVLKPAGNSAAALRLGCLEVPRDLYARGEGGCLILLDGQGRIPLGYRPPAQFTAVFCPFLPSRELMDSVDVFLPRPLWTEQGGTYLSVDGNELGRVVPVKSPPRGVRRTWEILVALAGRLGVRHLPEDEGTLMARTLAAMNLGTGCS